MSINSWYPVAWADEIGTGPKRVRMLGMDFVTFRDAANEIVLLSDVCCRRGGVTPLLCTARASRSKAPGASAMLTTGGFHDGA